MRHSIKYFVLGLFAIFFANFAQAQVTTSSLGGRIVDESGNAVIGAAVIAVHEPSGTTYGATTNLDGRYTIQGMRTGGPYKIEFSSLGYRTLVFKNITLNLGELYSLDAKLNESTENLSESIVVATPKSKFHGEKTGAATNISGKQLQSLPTVSRSISDITKLSPYGGGNMSFGGSDGRSTNFTVDGANFNNNFGLSSGLPGGGSPISLDAIEEMQVVIAPYDVRQTNFIGGGVNAITKSGTNTFKASAYVYHRNENMRGNRINNVELSERGIERTTTYGFTLGGPIIKNKLFFFINYEQAKVPKVVNRWRPSADGKADKDKFISRTTEEDMKKVADYLKKEYNYDPGSYTDYPAEDGSKKILARIDWNITRNHHLALRYNYTLNRGWRPVNGSSMDVSPRLPYDRLSEYSMAFSNSMYSVDNKVHSFTFDLNSRLSEKLSNQLLVTFSKIDDIRGSNSSPFPFVDIMAGMKDGKQILEPYMSFGYELFTWNNGVHNNVFTVKDDITYYLNKHKITAGFSFEYQMADNSYMRGGSGYYRYSSLDDFLDKKAPETVAITYGYGGEKNPAARVSFNQIGAYIQDDWNVSDRLKINAGLRFDTIVFKNSDLMTNNAIKSLDFAGRHVDTGRWPATSLQISPRFGFTWDVLGDKSLKVRGGTGLFAGRLPLVYFTNMPTNSGMVQLAKVGLGTEYESGGFVKKTHEGLSQFAGGLITSPEEIVKKLNSIDSKKFPLEISPDDGVIPGSIDGVSPTFKMPQVWKSSIAVDYAFPTSFPLSITGEFIFNKNINNTIMKDWNISDNSGWARYNGPDRRHIYPDNYRETYYMNNGKKAYPTTYILENTSKGYGYIANVTINAEPVKNLYLMAAYTHTVSKEMTGMPGNNASSVFQGLPTVEGPNFAVLQNSEYAIPHRFIASVSYKDKSNNSFSLFYTGSKGGAAYSYIYSSDLNNDGNINDLIYIPKTADEIKFVTNEDRDNFWAFVNQDEYLRTHKGQYAEAYSVYSPMTHQFDLRYAHDFKLKLGKTVNTLQLSFDLMNVGNLLNSSWGVYKTFSKGANGGKLLSLSKVDETGEPVYKSNVKAGVPTWDYSYSVGGCWYLQVGLKYMFN